MTMIREIVEKGDPILSKKCHPVTRFDKKLGRMLDDLTETLRDSGGVGLAAPQIGICRRMVVVMNAQEEIIELVNPEIISTSGEQTGFEGCLSLPGMYGEITRPMTVRVKAQNRQGEWFEAEDTGLTARCFCHEIDHLDGHMFDELCDRLYTSEELDEMEAAKEAEQEQEQQ
ncbi:MAG: peptide deformylase [Clostridiales bacterium]|nr:peptide deformylase [Clostridiales bacterium]